jgi:superfamily I DNA/RNA helicase
VGSHQLPHPRGEKQGILKEDLRVVTDDQLRNVLVEDAAQLAGYARDSAAETAICRQTGACTRDESGKCVICGKYRELMRICSAVDYDEQVLMACEILRQKPQLLNTYRKAASHLLVDEYQDINEAQYDFIRLLSDTNEKGLFVVGDDDQSIYSWRGRSPDHIRNFSTEFGARARVVPLLESHRCHRHILEGAVGIVERYDPGRIPKGQFEYKVAEGPKIQIHNTPSDEKEAALVRRIVEQALPSRDVLILFPSRQFSQAIVKGLRSHRIPFTAQLTSPGSGLPLLATLSRWFEVPSDSLSLRRCVEATLQSPSLRVPSARARTPAKKQQREAALGLVAALWKLVTDGQAGSLWEAIQIREAREPLYGSVKAALQALLDHSGDTKSTEEFLAAMARHLVPWKRVPDLLSEVGSWVQAIEEASQSSAASSVRLMTFQSAKGLEAKVVCVLGLEDGVIPRDGDVEIAE